MTIEEFFIQANTGLIIGTALTIIAACMVYLVFLKDNEIIIKKRVNKRHSA